MAKIGDWQFLGTATSLGQKKSVGKGGKKEINDVVYIQEAREGSHIIHDSI